jgi:hypothetical protein
VVDGNMQISYKSKCWKSPAPVDRRTKPATFNYEMLLNVYENRLIEEYIECMIHINFEDNPDVKYPREKLQWWLGSLERMEMESAFFNERFGVEFDELRKVMDKGIPRFDDMSKKLQEIYTSLNGESNVSSK